MMNLEKMKQKKSKNSVKKGLLAATTFLCLTTPLLQTQTAYAAENTTPTITIEKPDGWKQGETTIAVTVDASHMSEGFSIAKIEAKAGKDGSWQDVTGSGSITITGNQTVYVRVTDGEGKVYEQNRSIKCYDTEKPTLSASLTDGVLTIQGNDTVSGITAVTVNGTTYTDLKDGMLRVQLTQKDFTTKQIEITVTDGAGNTSEKYVLQNPYYEWAKKQAEKQKTSSDSNGAMATTTSADATGTEKTTTSPLPQDAQASEPTDAKGTVDDRTVTGIEKQLNKEGETADSVTKTATEGTKEFYPNLELGLGIALQDHGDPDKINLSYNQKFQIIKNTGYKSLPLYAVAKYNIPLGTNVKPYLKADLGYAYNFGEKDAIETWDGPIAKTSVDNGLYYGLGAGIEYNNFVVELMYKVNRAKVQHEYNGAKSSKFDYEYSRTTLSFGYRFDI